MVVAGQGRVRGTSAVLGLTLLMAGLMPGVARAAGTVAEGSTAAALACGISSGAVTAGGAVKVQNFSATSPPTTTLDRTETPGLFSPGQVRLSGSVVYDADFADGSARQGWMVIGGAMPGP